MSGYVGDLSPEQEQGLAEMKRRLDAIREGEFANQISKLEDSTVLRFLRARKWDLNAAWEMLLESLKFRTTFQGIGVENITADMVPNELKKHMSFFHKVDKWNQPVVIVQVRYHDANNRNLEESQRFLIYAMEYGKRLLKPPQEKVTLIFDMTDFGLKNMDYAVIKMLLECFQKYYPESLAHALILNSPWLFWGCWSIIKPWIDPITASKVIFVNNKQLVEYIPLENLLVEYGGPDKEPEYLQ